MKIVGLLSNEDELDEIEHIAKIFTVEQRMQNLPYQKKSHIPLSKKCTLSAKRISLTDQDICNNHLPMLTVRGLT